MPQEWYDEGRNTVQAAKRIKNSNKCVKNIVLIVGDGMGVSTVTAARIFDGRNASTVAGNELETILEICEKQGNLLGSSAAHASLTQHPPPAIPNLRIAIGRPTQTFQ